MKCRTSIDISAPRTETKIVFAIFSRVKIAFLILSDVNVVFNFLS